MVLTLGVNLFSSFARLGVDVVKPVRAVKRHNGRLKILSSREGVLIIATAKLGVA